MRIGTNQISYPQMRNFVGLPFQNVEFVKTLDIYKLISYPKFKLLGQVDYNLINRFNDFGLNKVDLYHFFNTITPIEKPWVVTFETTIPRPNKNFITGYRWMVKDSCKQLIPFSRRAFDFQCEILDFYPQFRDEIISKMKIVKPSQPLLLENPEIKVINDKIDFTFVGAAFFRKGGYELIKAFEILSKKYYYINLNVVTNFSDDGYCSKNITREIELNAKEIINRCPQINHFNGLNNQSVIQLLLNSHYSILPSYSETFGYYLLESMACGCPIITSNLRPFDEIVTEDEAFIYDVTPISPNRDYIQIDNPNNYKKYSQYTVDCLINLIEKAVLNIDKYSIKSKNCIDKIVKEYSPLDRVDTLMEIYSNALK